jgi:hypothetical protein
MRRGGSSFHVMDATNAQTLPPRLPAQAASAAVLVAMALGSLALWIAIPLGWFWVAGQLTAHYPSIYLIAIAACPLSMIAFAAVLSRLNRFYYDLRGRELPAPARSAWLKAITGERGRRPERTALDVLMVVSAAIALIALMVWLFAFAGSPLPG